MEKSDFDRAWNPRRLRGGHDAGFLGDELRRHAAGLLEVPRGDGNRAGRIRIFVAGPGLQRLGRMTTSSVMNF